MKKINEGFYEIEPELYAEMKEGQWFITDEESEDIAGPFSSLEDLAASRVEAWLSDLDPATAEVMKPGDPGFVNFKDIPVAPATPPYTPEQVTEMTDLVTLREAAQFLPVTRQNLEYHRNRGSLKVSPVVTGRTVELYSLQQLKEAFPS